MGGTHGKGGHQLVDFTLAERVFYPGGGGCHQKIEFVVAVFTVIEERNTTKDRRISTRRTRITIKRSPAGAARQALSRRSF